MKVCLLYNFAQHYRLPVYKALEKILDIHFYFGENNTSIKSIEDADLKGIREYFKRLDIFGGVYVLIGSLKLIRRPYTHYIILGEYLNLTNWLLAILLRLRGKKIIFWTHGLYGKEGWFKRNVIKTFLKLANRILVYNNRGRDILIKEGFDPDVIFVVYNSLDYERQTLIYSSLSRNDLYKKHFKNSGMVVVYIGRLQFRKKLEQLVYATKILQAKYSKKVNLVFIGDGEAKSKLMDICANENVNNQVWFVGELYDEKYIGELLFSADIGVSPGNIGLTAVHFFSYGLPFVTHNDFNYQMPEFEIMSENVTGKYFEKDNVESLAKSISEWIDFRPPRKDVQAACRQQVDKYYNPRYQAKVIYDCLSSLETKK